MKHPALAASATKSNCEPTEHLCTTTLLKTTFESRHAVCCSYSVAGCNASTFIARRLQILCSAKDARIHLCELMISTAWTLTEQNDLSKTPDLCTPCSKWPVFCENPKSPDLNLQPPNPMSCKASQGPRIQVAWQSYSSCVHADGCH